MDRFNLLSLTLIIKEFGSAHSRGGEEEENEQREGE
jgi:hypothetical protein